MDQRSKSKKFKTIELLEDIIGKNYNDLTLNFLDKTPSKTLKMINSTS